MPTRSKLADVNILSIFLVEDHPGHPFVDRVVSIRDGRIVYDGGPDYLKGRSYMDEKKEMSEKKKEKK